MESKGRVDITEQELNEKEAKNIDRVISSLKSILAFYKSKATPRRPLKSIRWALVVAIELCEKQIAKKPILSKSMMTKKEFQICPVCERLVLYDGIKFNYCQYCGQKLDWGN